MMQFARKLIDANRSASQWVVQRFPSFFEAPNSISELERQLSRVIWARADCRILECGGIDRPLLEKSPQYEYDGLDIEYQPTCKEVYDHFFVQSVEEELPGRYDLIISKTLIEHVPDNRKTWTSIFQGLVPGGETLHYIPCKNHPYSLATRLVGNKLQRKLIRLIRAEHQAVTGYKTFFDRCTPRALRRELERQGFKEISVQPYWDAEDYFAFFFPVFLVIAVFNLVCRKFNWSVFASGAVVYARRGID